MNHLCKVKKNRKYLKLFQILTKKDLIRFKKMLQSPFFNTNEHLLVLFSFLRSYHPKMDIKGMTDEMIFEKIFSGKNYSPQKLRNLFSEFCLLLEQYLVHVESQDNAQERNLKLLKVYHKRRAEWLYQITENRFNKGITEMPFYDAHRYFSLFQLNQIQLERITDAKKARERYSKLQESIEYHEYFYQISKQQYMADAVNLGTKRGFPAIEIKDVNDNLIIQIYKQIELLGKGSNTAAFFKIKELLYENQESLRGEMKLEILLFLINYATQIEYSDKSFGEIIFELYDWSAQNKVLMNEGVIPPTRYMNVVSVAIRLGKYKWLNEFRKQYEVYLVSEEREDIINYLEGYIYFHKKEFAKAVKQLREYKFKSNLREYLARWLEIRARYEVFEVTQKGDDELINKINSFESLIYRQSSSFKYFKNPNILFVKILKGLIKRELRGTFTIKETDKLINKLVEADMIASKPWLEKKVLKIG